VLLSGWADVAARHEWIASEGNQELLRLLGPYLDVEGLDHLDIEPDKLPVGKQILLWSDAKSESTFDGEVATRDVEDKENIYWHVAPVPENLDSNRQTDIWELLQV